uniref:Rhodanese domain-containing protein n=1 Tax=Setaria digitata TaxID=48799 RepID=A0A915PWD7_9BILA
MLLAVAGRHLHPYHVPSDLEALDSFPKTSIAIYSKSNLFQLTGTSSVIAESRPRQQHDGNCFSNSASILHASGLILHRQQATIVKDVACQCNGENDNANDDDNDSIDACGCASDDDFFPVHPSLPVKTCASRKRHLVTFRSPLSCMKLLDELGSENVPLFADTFCNSLLSSPVETTDQKTSACQNAARLPSDGTTDISIAPTSVTATATVTADTTTEQHESESAFTATVNSISTRKMTLASCYDITVVRVRRLMLSRSASDSKLLIDTRPYPQLGLAGIHPYDAHCKGIDELSRVTADIAAENPDMVRFQQVLNSWIGVHTGARIAAFLLISKECNSCFCQVTTVSYSHLSLTLIILQSVNCWCISRTYVKHVDHVILLLCGYRMLVFSSWSVD